MAQNKAAHQYAAEHKRRKEKSKHLPTVPMISATSCRLKKKQPTKMESVSYYTHCDVQLS